MSKVSKKQLLKRLETLEEWSNWADNMLNELNHALPDPEYDAKCEAEAADVDASLARHRERLGLNKPKLKQLDQRIFHGLDEKWRFAAVDEDGSTYAYVEKPRCSVSTELWVNDSEDEVCLYLSEIHDASNWQNSLIERDIAKELLEIDLSSGLTGSELVRAMLARGDKYVMCMVANNEANMFLATRPVIVHGCNDSGFISVSGCYSFAVAVNNQGEPLTASEVGL